MLSSKQIQYIETLYTFYNTNLFEGKLPEVIFSFSRDSKMSGMFLPEKFKIENKIVHELVINPDSFLPDSIDCHQMIVHEMCHVWQYQFGTPGKRGYHNQEFENIMRKVGLQTSDSGATDGNKTGYRMSDYILPDGLFAKIYIGGNLPSLEAEQMEPVKTEKPKTNTGTRIKYSCSCSNIWGKAHLQVSCNTCKQSFVKVTDYKY